MNNIAEGFDRNSDAELKQFLYYSKGSCSEVKSMIYLAKDLKYIDNDISEKLLNQSTEIGRMIGGFIKSLKNNPKK